MKLYDELIEKIEKILDFYNITKENEKAALWSEVSEHTMILRNEMAYELGNESFPGIGMTLVTDDASFVKEDSIERIGRDLDEISENGPYARISIIRVGEDTLGEGKKLYGAIKKLDHVRYHFYPEGFMLRLSAIQKKEGARISRESLKKGLSFAKIGRLLQEAYHKDSNVLAVRTLFVTEPEFDFEELKKLSQEADKITKAIDDIAQNVQMDCHVCSLQEVCEEVEGLRELHFSHK